MPLFLIIWPHSIAVKPPQIFPCEKLAVMQKIKQKDNRKKLVHKDFIAIRFSRCKKYLIVFVWNVLAAYRLTPIPILKTGRPIWVIVVTVSGKASYSILLPPSGLLFITFSPSGTLPNVNPASMRK